MTLKQFKNNIWCQLAFLLCLAVVCGAILGVVWYVSSINKPPQQGYDAGIYKTVYGENYTYSQDENFQGSTVTTTSHNGSVKSEEKVNVNDGASIVKITADVSYVKLEMYVVVKNESAEYIYFDKVGGTTFLSGFYNVENNVLQVADLVVNAQATITYDVLITAIKLAQNS